MGNDQSAAQIGPFRGRVSAEGLEASLPKQAGGTGARGHDLSHLGRVHCHERHAPQVGVSGSVWGYSPG